MKKVILRNYQSPGDIVMLTAAVRDLHWNYSGEYQTDVRTCCPDLWLHNPYITPLSEKSTDVEVIDCHYPLIHHSNQRPYHFIHGFIEFLNEQFSLKIRPTAFHGDIHLSPEERETPESFKADQGQVHYWLVASGGKSDYTIKWWGVDRYQEVVDYFRDRIVFVQIGEAGHYHPALRNVVDLRGKTTLRDLIKLVYFADGCITPVSLLMHLAPAIEPRKGIKTRRPCVVVAGGREPPHWEAYPTHAFLHTVGALPCCATGGCWRSRTLPLGDGDEKDKPENLCVDVVGDLPRCMDMITPRDVIGSIERLLERDRIKEAQLIGYKTNEVPIARRDTKVRYINDKALSVLVGCYGDYPQYSIRAIESLLKNCAKREDFNLYVGCNESAPAILNLFRRYLDRGCIDVLVESQYNINKDPMLRVLLELCTTPYILWLDDDSHVLLHWDMHILDFISKSDPFDVAGHVFYISERSDEHLAFLRKRPWYVSKEREAIPIWFATGGFFLARTAFLRNHSFPDRAMIKRADDVLLGELCQQQNGVLRDFGQNRDIMDRIKISDGERRGTGESIEAWLKLPAIRE